MRGSSAIALSIGIGAVIGAIVMGVPAIRQHLAPAPVAVTAPVTRATPAAPAVTTAATPAATPVAEKATETAPPVATPATPTAAPVTAVSTTGSTLDVKAALADRVLGNPDAPVTFYDYSSLSCPHCAQFHTTTLIQIKQHYIDDGKVKMVFRPFPLNEPALQGEKIARCAPPEQYFQILDLLFSKQDQWVFAPDVKSALRQMVKVAGITDKMFDDCMANSELEKGIMQIASDGVARHNLKGTPTFIFGSDMPNADTVAGEISYETFSQKLDALLSGRDPASVATGQAAASTPTPAAH